MQCSVAHMATDATVRRYEQQQAVKRVPHLVEMAFTLTGEQHVRNNVTAASETTLG